MSAQFDGIAVGGDRNRTGIGEEEQAFIFPSEAVSACVGSACTASACIGSVCTGSGCGGSVCVGSGCPGVCGNSSELDTNKNLRLALADGEIVQGACPFNRWSDFAVVQVSGFDVRHSDGTDTVRWILAGGPLVDFRVLKQTADGTKIVGEGAAKTGVLQQVSVDTETEGATYIVEIEDANGWLTVLSSDGETTRRPVLTLPLQAKPLEVASISLN